MTVTQEEQAAVRASRAPHPALRPYVKDYHCYAMDSDGSRMHHGLPSTALTMVLAFDEPLSVGWAPDRRTHGSHLGSVSGLHTRPAYIAMGPHDSGIQLALTPAGARALLGLPAAALQTCTVDLSDVIGTIADRLYERVAGAGSWSVRLDALDAALLHLLNPDRAAVRPALAWAWSSFVGGATRTQPVADAIGWSRSYLASAFRAEFGVRPKEIVRVRRMERAIALLAERRDVPLARIAADVGYADQAHLTREWRELADYSPAAWVREELPNVQASEG